MALPYSRNIFKFQKRISQKYVLILFRSARVAFDSYDVLIISILCTTIALPVLLFMVVFYKSRLKIKMITNDVSCVQMPHVACSKFSIDIYKICMIVHLGTKRFNLLLFSAHKNDGRRNEDYDIINYELNGYVKIS